MFTAARRQLPDGLRQQIEDCGFFPQLIVDSVALALGGEMPIAYLVHHEAMFSAELHRHLSVLVLTPTRLIISHTDEGMDGDPHSAALMSVESVGLKSIEVVTLTRRVVNPAAYPHGGAELVETWLTIVWGSVRKMELEKARCSDPACEADHGTVGTIFNEDLVIRMSPAADGESQVEKLIRFGSSMQQIVGSRA